MYSRFGLVLMVTQKCNMRCHYCYSTTGSGASMPDNIGRRAIDRAVASIIPGETLEMGFFGGEPLLESDLVLSFIDYAQHRTKACGMKLVMSLTTNGTVDTPSAWTIVMKPEMNIAVSLDGRRSTHNLHRCYSNGRGSATEVEAFVKKLIQQKKAFRVATVVQPESVIQLDQEILYLHELGASAIDLALNLWTQWEDADMDGLERAIVRCGKLWKQAFPRLRINWFEDKVATLMVPESACSNRCGFGKGDITVSVSGHLYPCERLIGNDESDNPMRLPGHIDQGEDFLLGPPETVRHAAACRQCAIADMCNTCCGCCNYARSGDAGRPDRLLCLWNQWCLRETQSHLADLTNTYDHANRKEVIS